MCSGIPRRDTRALQGAHFKTEAHSSATPSARQPQANSRAVLLATCSLLRGPELFSPRVFATARGDGCRGSHSAAKPLPAGHSSSQGQGFVARHSLLSDHQGARARKLPTRWLPPCKVCAKIGVERLLPSKRTCFLSMMVRVVGTDAHHDLRRGF